MLADTVVVPPNIDHVDKETSNPSIIRKLLTNPLGQTHSLVTNQTLTLVAWMVSGEYLFEKGVSVKAANLISNSRKLSSLSGYDSSWKKWSG